VGKSFDVKVFLKKVPWTTFIPLLLLVFLLGSWGSIFTQGDGLDYYYSLPEPFVRPPGWVFGVVWPILFVLMAVSATIVWESPKTFWRKAFIYTFGFNLVCNSFWSALFFGFQEQVWAFVDLFLIWASIIALMWFGWKVSKKAVWLLLPYLLWVTFAGTLSLDILF
jgi:tryptophan-rich sensory protein